MEVIPASPKRSIRDLRLAKGLTQMQLGIAANIDQTSISRLESGRVKPSGLTLQRLAKALGVDANAISLDDTAA